MPTPRKLNLFIANFAYGGNGGIANEHPDIREWFCETMMVAKDDPRIGDIRTRTFSDTPICMTRNAAVLTARKLGADVLLMCDSDQAPNLHSKEQGFKPFFKSSFDYLYDHYEKGPVVIGAPYCGPPPHENVYVFRWGSTGDYGEETSFSLDQYTRHEASRMSGIQECAALPTGMILCDMRAFDLIEPVKMSQRRVLEELEARRISVTQAMRNLSQGWFYYEWKDQYAAEKASTEDVTATRDMSLAGLAELGYNPVMCNWDSPIGHWKPWCVRGRPALFTAESVSDRFKKAVERGTLEDERIIDMPMPDRFKGLPINHVTPEYGTTVMQNGQKIFVAAGHKTPDSHLDALSRFIHTESKRRNKTLDVAEIGSWHGDSAIAMVKDNHATVLCIDHWKGSDNDLTGIAAGLHDPFKAFMENTKAFRECGLIKHIRADSLDAIKFFDDEYFDVILYDAAHGREATLANIAAYWPKLHPHGTLIVHDYKVHQFPGTTEAVEECFEPEAIEKLGFDGIGWGYAVIRKAATAYTPEAVSV